MKREDALDLAHAERACKLAEVADRLVGEGERNERALPAHRSGQPCDPEGVAQALGALALGVMVAAFIALTSDDPPPTRTTTQTITVQPGEPLAPGVSPAPTTASPPTDSVPTTDVPVDPVPDSATTTPAP